MIKVEPGRGLGSQEALDSLDDAAALHREHLGFVFVEVVLPAVVPTHPRPHGEAALFIGGEWGER